MCGAPSGAAFGPSTTTLGPYPTAVLLRVFLHDIGIPSVFSCDYTAYNDQPAGITVGTNPYAIGIVDSDVCTHTPTNPLFPPASPHDSNFEVTLTIN
jgi:hypothetical protein